MPAFFKKFLYIRIIFLSVLFLMIILTSSLSFSDNEKEKPLIVILNSYHQTLRWTNDVTKGILEELNNPGTKKTISVEYMDWKNNPTPELLSNLENLYKLKYSRKKVNIVITSDDVALSFALKNRDSIFPGASIVFCGLNGYNTIKPYEYPDVTGVTEELNPAATIESIFMLLPDTKKIWIVNDNTETGKEILSKIKADAAPYEKKAEFVFKDNITVKEAADFTAQAQTGTVVLLGSWVRDREGTVIDYGDFTERLKKNCKVPLFTLWDLNLHRGTIGGSIISAFKQGQISGQMANEILQGKSAKSIPPVLKNSTQYVFDYKELHEFGIPLSSLPRGSMIINKPQSIFELYFAYVISAIAVISVLLIISLFLSYIIIQRRKTEKFLKTIIDSLPGLVFLKNRDGKYKLANQTFCDYANLSFEQIVGKTDGEIFPKELAEEYRRNDQRIIESAETNLIIDEQFETSQGKRIPISVQKAPLKDKWGRVSGVISLAIDFSERLKAEEKLQSQNIFLQSMMDTIPNPIFFKDKNGVYKGCNKAFEEFYGKDRNTMIGKTVFDLWPTEMAEMYFRKDKELIDKPGVQIYEYVIQRHDGIVRNVIFNKATYFEQDGSVGGLIGMVVDITDRKKVEEGLKDSEERFRTMIEQSPFSIQVLSPDGYTVQINHAFEELWGSKIEDMREYNILEDQQLVDLGVMEQIKKAFNGEAQQLPPVQYNVKMSLDKGNLKWVQARIYPIKDETGNIRNVILVHEDITEKVIAEENLVVLNKRLTDIIEFLPDATFIIDKDKKIITWNRAMEEMTGIPKEKIIGKDHACASVPFYGEPRKYLIDLIDTDDELLKSRYSYVRRKRNVLYSEAFAPALYDGKGAYIFATASPLIDRSGNFIGAIELIRDVTDKKQFEEQRASLEDQLRQSKKIETIGMLAGGVAHDFNNLLTPIIGNTDFLMSEISSDDPRREYVEEIMIATKRAKDLTRQLLAFGRKQMLELKTIDLRSILTNFEHILKRTIRENISIELHLSTEPCVIYADVGQVEQVIMNLAINAQDAMPKGGLLCIQAERIILDELFASRHAEMKPGEYVMLCVNDTGMGMSKETIDHVFEPFYTTKERGKGTGLGLSTVYGIVKQHGGNITIYSEPEKGTTFKIYLPVSKGLPENQENSEIYSSSLLPAKGKETILVVDDDNMVRTITCDMLRRLGYNVLTSDKAEECIKIVKEYKDKIDILLTDVVMPGVDGKELYKKLSEIRRDLKVIYMSGYADDIIVHHGIIEEGVNFIQKPLSTQKLSEKIRKVLDGNPNLTPPPFQ